MIIRDNEGPGINMNNAVGNVIGGELHGYYSNYIYGHKGNGGNGISMIIGSDNNTIQFTAIGVTETYRPGPNSRSGIFTECSGHIIRQNVISGNEYDGIQIDGRGVNLNTIIERNLIGTNELGFDTIPNLGNGISIFRSGGDRIENNIVGGNKGNGIYVADVSSSNVTIVHNKVGIRVSKTFLRNYCCISSKQFNQFCSIVR